MAASLGSVHLHGAAAVGSVNGAHGNPTAKGAPDNRSQSRDFSPPPPKKVRVEEKSSVKPRKLGGGNGSGKADQQTTTQHGYGVSSPGLWTFSPAKTSSSHAPVVPATGGHKVFKQSDFFLHKAPSSSSSKPKSKPGEKGKGGGEEKKKHKLLLTSAPGSNVNNNSDDVRGFINISAVKRENGEVMLSAHGEPLHVFPFIFMLL